ncbi:hypothetical protein TNCV_3265621 [Trichonephila clavipes]|nr:hypothetical protein TNCV_3265621 [Trichonephila clavipes]
MEILKLKLQSQIAARNSEYRYRGRTFQLLQKWQLSNFSCFVRNSAKGIELKRTPAVCVDTGRKKSIVMDILCHLTKTISGEEFSVSLVMYQLMWGGYLPNTDLSDMFSQPLYLEQMKHQTFVLVCIPMHFML